MKEALCRFFVLLATAFAVTIAAADSEALRPDQAADHIGAQATVCGTVASATFASRSRGRPTFLNLGRAYPDHIFTAVVWGRDRGKFNYDLISLRGERICVTGRISSYRGKPQIEVSRSSQIFQPSS